MDKPLRTGRTEVLRKQRRKKSRTKKSRTKQWVQRSLLTPDECLRLPGPVKDAEGQIQKPGDMLVFCAGAPAIYGRQPLYFQDPVFAARAAIPPPPAGENGGDSAPRGREGEG